MYRAERLIISGETFAGREILPHWLDTTTICRRKKRSSLSLVAKRLTADMLYHGWIEKNLVLAPKTTRRWVGNEASRTNTVRAAQQGCSAPAPSDTAPLRQQSTSE